VRATKAASKTVAWAVVGTLSSVGSCAWIQASVGATESHMTSDRAIVHSNTCKRTASASWFVGPRLGTNSLLCKCCAAKRNAADLQSPEVCALKAA